MFNIGDTVYVKKNNTEAKVVYVEDGYIVVETNAGVELDFENFDALETPEEHEERWQAELSPKPAQTGIGTYIPQKGDSKRASVVIKEITKHFPVLLDVVAYQNENYADLSDYEKVVHISKITGTPMVVFMGSVENGMNLMPEVLRKTMLNNVFSDSGLITDMMMVKIQKDLRNG